MGGRCFLSVGRKTGERAHPVACRSVTPLVCLGSPSLVVGTEERIRRFERISCFCDTSSYSVVQVVCSSEGPRNKARLIPYLTFLCMFLRKEKTFLSDSYRNLKEVLNPYIHHQGSFFLPLKNVFPQSRPYGLAFHRAIHHEKCH